MFLYQKLYSAHCSFLQLGCIYTCIKAMGTNKGQSVQRHNGRQQSHSVAYRSVKQHIVDAVNKNCICSVILVFTLNLRHSTLVVLTYCSLHYRIVDLRKFPPLLELSLRLHSLLKKMKNKKKSEE